ncbi:MAG: acyltransferase domain-containing protein, partial [Planctomycetes bacterium]|nr:acyltransferase domain-containing protein [Planctomycetota bacterium]
IATELGVRDLLTGVCDLVLVGGVHIFSDVPFLQVFTAMGALSRSGTIRPFDRDGDGIVSGEGVGILVLKRLQDAVADDDRIYAVVKGVGSSSDGRATSVAAPRVEGEELALRRAYEVSGIDPATVGLIEGHGTGTPIGDPTEIEALHRVFGFHREGPPSCALGSIKSMIGHAMPAAGAAGMIKSILALYHGILPPTLNCSNPLETITQPGSRFYVNTQTRPWIHGASDAPRRAGVSGFGFGGVNAHVVLEEYGRDGLEPWRPTDASGDAGRATADRAIQVPERPTLIQEWDTEVCVLEADTQQTLADAAARLCAYIAKADGVSLRDIAYTCNTSLSGASHRLAVVATSVDDLAEKLARAAERLRSSDCTQIKDTQGIYYFGGSEIRGGKVALLFPGEGAQYVNMLSDLCLHFPEVRACFEAADRAVQRPDRSAPSADIFPPPFFSDQEKEAAEARLWKIERATEAVLTADGAMYSLLTRLGVRADMLAGHSAGEWIALAAGGVVGIEEFVAGMDRLDAMYRELADDATIPKMAMLAVGAGRDKVVELASEIKRTVHIANDNCPHQVVIVVAPEDADLVSRHLRSRGLFVEKLPYDRGYHTPVFTYICDPLRKHFDSLNVQSPKTLLYSCTTATPYPKQRDQILDLVSNTFARPLLFRDTVEAMYEAGARIFVEVGPRGVLTAFVDDILRGRPHVGIATDHPRRSGTRSLNHALGQLAALHVPLDLSPLYARRSPRKLTWDPQTDHVSDPDTAPGTMQVSLCYPRLALTESPITPKRETQEESRPASPESADESSDASDKTPAPIPAAPVARVAQNVPDAGLTPPLRTNDHPAPEETQASRPPPPVSHVMREHLHMMESFLQTQEEVMRAYMGTGRQPLVESAEAYGDERMQRPQETQSRTTTNPSGVQSDDTDQAPSAAAAPPTEVAPIVSTDVAPASAPATKPSTEQPDGLSPSQLEELLISIVSDKTGYPSEMLDLDLDMEADLGIDSIKRIEILGGLQESAGAAFASSEMDMEKVAGLKTLREVLGFLEKEMSESDSSQEESAESTPDAARLAFAGKVVRFTPRSEILVVRTVDIEEDLYLRDHCLDPPASECQEDRGKLPVVPLTVSLEMMAEVAGLLWPNRKVVKVKAVRASRWIDLEPGRPKVKIAITAKAGAADEVDVAIRIYDDAMKGDDPPAGAPVAECTIVLADSFPTAPAVA